MTAIAHFIEVVSRDQFVEGHEVLETEWHRLKKIPEQEDEAKILKGLINASTALALACQGKAEGAQRVWKPYEKYAPFIQETLSLMKPRYEEAQKLLLSKKNLYM